MRTDPFVPGEWYHCYNRGVEKKIIFHHDRDFERFLMLLYACNSSSPIHISNINQKQGPTLLEVFALERGQTLVDIGVHTLMSNHFHLLVREKETSGITQFMRKLATAYAMYYNIKYERTGTLFQGKFKSRRVHDDFYMRRLINYIHANPAEIFEPNWKQGKIGNEALLRRQLCGYRYSSLPDYLGNDRPEKVIINQDSIFSFTEKKPNLEDIFDEAHIFAQDQEILDF